MRKRLLAAIVSTIEGLENCAGSNCPLFYIVAAVYESNKAKVIRFAAKEGYDIEMFPAQNGLFLSKNIDPDNTEIVNYEHFTF